jgi:predicted Zn-dependent protease
MATSIGISDSDYGNYIVDGAELGAQLLTHRYGRSAELESDYYGIEYMVRAGYDPRAAISLQESFVELSAGSTTSWMNGLFASHPPSGERVAKNRETVAALSPQLLADLETGELRYQQQIAYLKGKNDAYTAFEQAKTLAANASLDSALKKLRVAIEGEPAEARFYGLMGDIYLEKKQYREAKIYYNKALALDSEYYEYYLGRGLSFSKLGQTNAAREDFKKSNALLPTAIAMNELGELSLIVGDRQSAKKYFQVAMSAGGETGQAASSAYTKLDLPENPAKYFKVRPYMDEGRLVATISNRTGFYISDFKVTYVATVNGKPMQRTITLGPISAGQQVVAESGFRFRQQDSIERVSVTVIRARF